MARPNIVRADTLDLQDQENPTAAEHQKHPSPNGLAPHQRAELEHVIEERHSEEQALSEAWNIADNLAEEPDVLGLVQEQQKHEGGDPSLDGVGEEDDDGGDTEIDADDDMMDRISSSPSIDDGAYLLDSSPRLESTPPLSSWPMRKSSLTPPSSEKHTPTRGETFNQSASDTLDSSPYLCTPDHLPLRSQALEDQSNYPCTEVSDHFGCPFDGPPRYLSSAWPPPPLCPLPLESVCHQTSGRYELEPDLDAGLRNGFVTVDVFDEGYHEDSKSDIPQRNGSECQLLAKLTRASSTQCRSETAPSDSFSITTTIRVPQQLETSSSIQSINSINIDDILLPKDDPLLDIPLSPTPSSDSWESASSICSEDSLDCDIDGNGTDVLFTDLNDRFIDSGWGGECLRETEDIDFEFVYALHTFVATIEGQANATKGDTMVLLDDSNSYWWLVRLVKDRSIGYLPAEHIETPTERLARLNKHRNIDLSATMLSDNSEKSRNPLKKAIRRRNAKTVQFAAPTYVDAPEYDYSDDEDEDQPLGDSYLDGVESEQTQQLDDQAEVEAAAEPKTSIEDASRSSSPRRRSFDREQAATAAAALNSESGELSPKLIDKTEAAPLKSRKGTPRNTDSFLKDDSIETRKITLTPGILRDESISLNSISTSSESQRKDSVDKESLILVKQNSPTDSLTKKDSKKEKRDKKAGILSGFFKSKKRDKRSKDDLGQESDMEKQSMEFGRESPTMSDNASPSQSAPISPVDNRKFEVQTRQPTGFRGQKNPPGVVADTMRLNDVHDPMHGTEGILSSFGTSAETALDEVSERPNTASTGLQQRLTVQTIQSTAREGSSPVSPVGAIANFLKRDDSKSQKPTKAKRSKQRVELDDFDSPIEERPQVSYQDSDQHMAHDTDEEDDDLSESPVEITADSFIHGTENARPPGLTSANSPWNAEKISSESLSIIDNSSDDREQDQEDSDPTPTGPRSPLSHDISQVEPMQLATSTSEAPTSARNFSTDSTTTSSSSLLTPSSQQSWSDASLRSWLDDGSEVKDMMVLIHDTTGVEPVPLDHPLMVGLFSEQRKGVQDMMTQLDGLLGSYLQRKGIDLP